MQLKGLRFQGTHYWQSSMSDLQRNPSSFVLTRRYKISMFICLKIVFISVVFAKLWLVHFLLVEKFAEFNTFQVLFFHLGDQINISRIPLWNICFEYTFRKMYMRRISSGNLGLTSPNHRSSKISLRLFHESTNPASTTQNHSNLIIQLVFPGFIIDSITS